MYLSFEKWKIVYLISDKLTDEQNQALDVYNNYVTDFKAEMASLNLTCYNDPVCF